MKSSKTLQTEDFSNSKRPVILQSIMVRILLNVSFFNFFLLLFDISYSKSPIILALWFFSFLFYFVPSYNHSSFKHHLLQQYHLSLREDKEPFFESLSACQCRRCQGHGLIPVSGRTPGAVNENPLQYSCLENSMDR